jgi:hypothetical protein
MPAKRECYNCGRTVNGRSAIETVDYDLWGDPMSVWLCRECYGAGVSTVQPAQPALGFPDERPTEDAAA